jgi:hypothetical protein
MKGRFPLLTLDRPIGDLVAGALGAVEAVSAGIFDLV